MKTVGYGSGFVGNRGVLGLLAALALSSAGCTMEMASSEDFDVLESPVIYGSDNRVDYRNTTQTRALWADQVGLLMDKSGLTCAGDACIVTLNTSNLCAEEKFGPNAVPPFGQEVAEEGRCTAFLVGSDLMATAGHCIDTAGCADSRVLLDFYANELGHADLVASPDHVYSCKSIVARERSGDRDYAIFKLDRAVPLRTPLPIRHRGKINSSEDLLLIGHPTALPKKIADGAKVKDNTIADVFLANLDAFGGNSGSPVFNRDTGVVEGILVSGNTDYLEDSTGCLRVNQCGSSTGCTDGNRPFEASVRTSQFDEFVPSIAPRTFTSVSQTQETEAVPVAGDFNGDGNGDIVWYVAGSGADVAWWGRADQTFDKPSDDFSVQGTYKPISGDFDGDTATDILWYKSGSSSHPIWFGKPGTRGFTGSTLSASGSATPFVGDFDGDGRSDVFLYAAGDTSDSILWGNTDRTFTSASASVSGTYTPVAADFNGDGFDDIAWYKPTATTHSIWWGTSSRSFSPKEKFDMPSSFIPLAGDFDGDGFSDIFWYAPGDTSEKISWGKSGHDFISANTLKSPSNATKTYTPVVADFDGNTASDIFWYRGSGSDSTWFGRMN